MELIRTFTVIIDLCINEKYTVTHPCTSQEGNFTPNAGILSNSPFEGGKGDVRGGFE